MTEVPFKDSAKHLPLDAVMTFGIFKGMTVQQVADTRASYLVWAIENVKWFELTREARKYAQRRLNVQRQAAMDRAAFGGIFPDSPDDGDEDEGGGLDDGFHDPYPTMENYHDSDSW